MKRSVSLTGSKVKATHLPRTAKLLAWYDEHRRILPWRALAGVMPDPYRIWLSEVMLQQTTVAAVGPYFQKFIKRWPNLKALARAPLEEVLEMWAGLGYYRRAHALHSCAQKIAKDFGGVFPDTEIELMALPGFGLYTSAAVASIAFDQRANVVDGNVERVMARLFAIETPLPKGKEELRQAASKLLPNTRYGDYAQALMDLGATICTPKSPKCGLCPWMKSCKARALGTEEAFPRRLKVKPRPIRRGVAFVILDKKNKKIFLRRRPKEGLLGGMMEVPSTVWRETTMPLLNDIQKEAPFRADFVLIPGKIKHVFSHFELELAVAFAASFKKSKVPHDGTWVAFDKLSDVALPSVMHKIVRHAFKAIY